MKEREEVDRAKAAAEKSKRNEGKESIPFGGLSWVQISISLLQIAINVLPICTLILQNGVMPFCLQGMLNES